MQAAVRAAADTAAWTHVLACSRCRGMEVTKCMPCKCNRSDQWLSQSSVMAAATAAACALALAMARARSCCSSVGLRPKSLDAAARRASPMSGPASNPGISNMSVPGPGKSKTGGGSDDGSFSADACVGEDWMTCEVSMGRSIVGGSSEALRSSAASSGASPAVSRSTEDAEEVREESW